MVVAAPDAVGAERVAAAEAGAALTGAVVALEEREGAVPRVEGGLSVGVGDDDVAVAVGSVDAVTGEPVDPGRPN
jgi:hypothetical protein